MDYLKDTSLYFQTKEHLKKYIEDNGLKAGDCLPPEKDLTARYGVSRITMRRAMEELEREGFIYRLHGKGTYVSSQRINVQLSYLSSFTEDMLERGYSTFSKILELKVIPPDDVVKKALHLENGKNIILLERIRYADNQPIALEKCYIPQEPFANIIHQNLENQSLNKLMQTMYNIRFSYAKQWIGTKIASKEVKKIFGITTPIALLAMKRNVYDVNDIPVQYTISYYRGDFYEYEITLPMKNLK